MFNTVTIWLIVGILLLLSEFLIPGFTIFFFGVGALVTSLLIFLVSPLQDVIWLQVFIFIITSALCLIFLRRYFNTTLKGEIFKEREDYIGEECLVIESTSPEKRGRIKFQGTTWNAYSENSKLKKGQKAIILRKKPDDPMIFIIKKIVKEK